MITKRSCSVRRGGLQVSEMQRSRMLSSAVRVVSEYGYRRMSVARVAGGARVSRRTFYEVFADREDCFLAAFEEAVARAEAVVVDAYEREDGVWREKVRAALLELLVFLDGLLVDLPMRLTYRTMRVLSAIGEHPGASNRRVGEIAGTSDQGQISKLLMRLEKLGLVENVRGGERSRPMGEPNAWRLTARGEEIWRAVVVSTASGGGGS
jgi:AcrR family transcriptional regulator